MAIETYFKNIADAIRARSGSSALITPGNMPGAIENIPGGGVEFETVYSENLHNGHVTGNSYNYSGSTYPDVLNDVYILTPGNAYAIFIGNDVSNRCRAIDCYINPVTTTSNITGTSLVNIDNPPAFTGAYFIARGGYLVITKTTTGVIVPSYLLNINDLL